MPRIHQLGDERQTRLLARLLEDLERLLAESLERVRRGARLEGTAAEHRHSCGRDAACGLHRLGARLHGARAGDETEVPVADATAAGLDHGRVRRELSRAELVRLEDPQHLLDARIALERQCGEQLALADRADHRRLAPRRDEGGAARLPEPGRDSITVDYDPSELRRSTLDLAAMLFATGLDAARSTVFCQSHVTAHAEAAWLLAAVTSYGQLGRMTQFKDKSENKEFISAGLF